MPALKRKLFPAGSKTRNSRTDSVCAVRFFETRETKGFSEARVCILVASVLP
jgi:hypothetical protein